MLNIFLGGILLLASVYMGRAVDKYYENGKCRLETISTFVDYAEGRVEFSGENIIDIVEGFCKKHPSIIGDYLKTEVYCLDNKNSPLSTKEREIISDFLRGLTDLDSAAHKRFFDATRKTLCAALTVAEENKLKKGIIAKKLSPLIGLGVFLLVI